MMSAVSQLLFYFSLSLILFSFWHKKMFSRYFESGQLILKLPFYTKEFFLIISFFDNIFSCRQSKIKDVNWRIDIHSWSCSDCESKWRSTHISIVRRRAREDNLAGECQKSRCCHHFSGWCISKGKVLPPRFLPEISLREGKLEE